MADLTTNITVTVADECPHDDLDVPVTVRKSGGGFILSPTATCRKCGLKGQFAIGKTGYTETPAIAFFMRPVAAEQTPPKKSPDPSLAKSKILRTGLKAGAVAPEWALPGLDGSEWKLSQLRGRRVLLVFSDPHCGPCDFLAPKLQEVQEARPDLQVFVISRGDADEARKKVGKFGTTYPVVMQKGWATSKEYGMFATPIGYLIDENGVLLSDVAIGPQQILALVKPDGPVDVQESDCAVIPGEFKE